MIVLDTTVLVYAQGSDHPLREPCQRLLTAVGNGAVDATTTVEVIQEFTHVRNRRQGRETAVRDARALLGFLGPLLTTDEAALRTGLDLYAASHRLGSFDAVLAATALTAGAEAIVSADLAFADIPGLGHVVPDHEGVALLLGA